MRVFFRSSGSALLLAGMALGPGLHAQMQTSNGNENQNQIPKLQLGASNAVEPTDADTHLTAARALIKARKPAAAESEVQAYLDSGKDSYNARVLMGLIRFHQDRAGDSLAEFTRAAKFRKPAASVLVVVALDYVKLRDLPSADKWISVAIQMSPRDGLSWQYLGGIRYGENRFGDAIEAYEACLKLHPQDVAAEDGIGRSLEGLSRDDQAGAAYRTALEWQSIAGSKYHEPLLHLGALLLRQGHAAEALPYLAEAESLAPGDADTHIQLGQAYTRLKQLDKAQAELEKAVTLEPGSSSLHWLLASVYRREGLTAKADAENGKFAAMVGAHSNDRVP